MKPNWAKQEYKLARTEDRAPDLRWDRDQESAACAPIHVNREWIPQAQEEQPQYPQPGYRVPANIWNLDIENRSNQPGPMASFLRHVATM